MRPERPGGTAPGDRTGIRCAEAIELVTMHLDDALDDRDRGLFARHVDSCAGCTRYVAQIRRTIQLTGLVLEHVGVARPPDRDGLRAAFVARRRRSG